MPTRVVEAGRTVVTIVRRDIEQLLHDVESAVAAGHDPQSELRTIDAAERFIEAVKHGVRAVVREDRAFDPSPPRVPASEPDGGQWLGHNHRVTGSAKPKPATKPKVTWARKPRYEKPAKTKAWAHTSRALDRNSDVTPIQSATSRLQNLRAQTRNASDLRLSPAATRVVAAGRPAITIVPREDLA